jgi:heterodisulfide reductase subunit B
LPYKAALEKIEESETSGAEAMIKACPWCKRYFNDAIKETAGQALLYGTFELVEQVI